MANRGKQLQIGGGSRRPSQARAEDAARKSRKIAAQGRALLGALDEEHWAWREPARDPVMDAMALLHVAAWEFGNALASLTPRVAYPDDHFQTVYLIGDGR